jgi:hypothetical protein
MIKLRSLIYVKYLGKDFNLDTSNFTYHIIDRLIGYLNPAITSRNCLRHLGSYYYSEPVYKTVLKELKTADISDEVRLLAESYCNLYCDLMELKKYKLDLGDEDLKVLIGKYPNLFGFKHTSKHLGLYYVMYIKCLLKQQQKQQD